jgi:hypothetical protein
MAKDLGNLGVQEVKKLYSEFKQEEFEVAR